MRIQMPRQPPMLFATIGVLTLCARATGTRYRDCFPGQSAGPGFISFDECVGALSAFDCAVDKIACTTGQCGGGHSHHGCRCNNCTAASPINGSFACGCSGRDCECAASNVATVLGLEAGKGNGKGTCESDSDCSLLGVCNVPAAAIEHRRTCTCDPGWTGVDCATADLLPYDDVVHQGYVNTSRASWGGRPLLMPSGKWQLFATEIKAKCPLILFMNNSMVVRAESTTTSPLGPYVHKSTVRDEFAHNPTAVGPTRDGYYLVYSIGGRSAGDARPNPIAWGLDCTDKLPACAKEDRCRSHGTPDSNGQVVLSYSHDPLNGPWTHRVVLPIGGNGTTPPNSAAAWNCKHNNPTALLNASTGAVMLMYHGSSCDGLHHGERLGLADAAHWNDTVYTKRAGPPIVSPNNGTGSHEDPFMWIDNRGHYHVMTHNQGKGNLCGDSSSCGAHLYSKDSRAWKISAHPAYNSSVQLKSTGKVVQTGTRQRPQLVFSNDAERRPIALFNGGSFDGNNGDLNMLTHTFAFAFANTAHGSRVPTPAHDQSATPTAAVVTTPAAHDSGGCTFAAAAAPGGAAGGCVVFTGLVKLPANVWKVRDSSKPLSVFVAAPCHNVTAAQTTCATFASENEAPAFQQSELAPYKCYALGDVEELTTALINPTNASAGVVLTYAGGSVTNGRARSLKLRMECDPSASEAAGPSEETRVGPEGDLVYGVTWRTPHACTYAPAPASACAEPPPPPPPPHRAVAVPTVKQLAWQDLEVGAMLGFNLQSNCIATSSAGRSTQPCLSFNGATGNTPAARSIGDQWGWVMSPEKVAAWNPAELDTDAWALTAKSFGAKYVVLVAQHMAGFSLWDTKAHNFSIAHTAYKGGGQDVVKDMVASCKKYGLKLGMFYSVHFNWWLGVSNYRVGQPRIDANLPNITQAEFVSIAQTQLTELAGRFGEDGPVEIWFDGGTGPNVAAISQTVMKVAPGAVCHSCYANFSNGGTVRWMGNENGVMPLPSWGSGGQDVAGNGDPLSSVFNPPSCDAVLREHFWFFSNTSNGQEKGVPSPTIGLVHKYLTSVGRASNIILNIGPDGRTGAIPENDAARYAEMGTAVQCLFSQPIANTSSGLAMDADGEIVWKLPAPVAPGNISIVLREDQRAGQLVGDYSLWCGTSLCEMSALAGNVIPAYQDSTSRSQTGIGHKRILLMAPTASFDKITLKVASHYAVVGQTPTLRDISLFDWGGKVESCV